MATSSPGVGGAGGRAIGGSQTNIGIGTAVAQLVQEIEELSCVHLRDGSMAPRQLACILWMFGRLGIQPSMSEFRGLICVFIRERVCGFLHACMLDVRTHSCVSLSPVLYSLPDTHLPATWSLQCSACLCVGLV